MAFSGAELLTLKPVNIQRFGSSAIVFHALMGNGWRTVRSGGKNGASHASQVRGRRLLGRADRGERVKFTQTVEMYKQCGPRAKNARGALGSAVLFVSHVNGNGFTPMVCARSVKAGGFSAFLECVTFFVEMWQRVR